jgi:O-antigen ligase
VKKNSRKTVMSGIAYFTLRIISQSKHVLMQSELKVNKILTILICLSFTGFFFSIMVGNLLLLVLLLFCATRLRPVDLLDSLRGNSLLQLFCASYLLLLIGLLYTKNISVGFFALEKKVALLFAPLLLIPTLKKVKYQTEALFTYVGLITIVSSFVMLLTAACRFYLLDVSNAFYYQEITPIHYVYYAIYFAVGSLFLINSLINQTKHSATIKWGLVALTGLYATFILVLIASKTGIIAFLAGLSILLYKKIDQKRLVLMGLVPVIISTGVLLATNPTTLERFKELNHSLHFLTLNDLRGEEINMNGLSMRLLFWKISTTHLINDGLFLAGVGTGDAQDYINSLFLMPTYDIPSYVGWDPHNQWVFGFVQLGLLGVALLFLIYLKCIRMAIKTENYDLLVFVIITGFFSLSESFLESNKGIVFFSVLLPLLVHRQQVMPQSMAVVDKI